MLYAFIIFICVILALVNRKNINTKPGFYLMILGYFVYYGLPGVYSSFNFHNDIDLLNLIYARDDVFVILGVFSTVLSLLFAYIGYRFIDRGVNDYANLSPNNAQGQVFTLGVLPILFSVFSLYLYSLQYGGLSNALASSAMIRAGLYTETVGPLTFFKYFIPLFLVSYAYWFARFIRAYRGWKYLFYFCVSLFWGVYAFSFMAGRTRFVFLLLIPLIVWIVISSKFNYRRFLIGGVISLFVSLIVIDYGKSAFNVLLSEESSTFSEVESDSSGFVGYFTHRVYATEVAWERFVSVNEIRGLEDILYAPLFIIPSRITGLNKPDSISYHVTERLTGVYDSMIPPGIVAYGLFSFSVVGLIFFSFVYGTIYALFDRQISKSNHKQIFYIVGVVYWFYYGSTGDIRIIVNSFAFFIPVILYFVTRNFFKRLR